MSPFLLVQNCSDEVDVLLLFRATPEQDSSGKGASLTSLCAFTGVCKAWMLYLFMSIVLHEFLICGYILYNIEIKVNVPMF